jgi:hypothetical protein
VADWTALSEFVASRRLRRFGVLDAIRAADLKGTDRFVTFRSAYAIRYLIDEITAYATTWDVPWAVSLNRVLPRLFQAISASEGR